MGQGSQERAATSMARPALVYRRAYTMRFTAVRRKQAHHLGASRPRQIGASLSGLTVPLDILLRADEVIE
jgi:hypothetical protein